MSTQDHSRVAPETVSPESLAVIIYHGQPVLTTDMLALLYGADQDQIHDNYRKNIDRFEEGKHFHKLEGEALREFKKALTGKFPVSRARHLMLWTERGAARHAKMLDTEKAWEVFEKLEDCYFGKKEPIYGLKELPPPEPSAETLVAIKRRAWTCSQMAYENYQIAMTQSLREGTLTPDQLPYWEPSPEISYLALQVLAKQIENVYHIADLAMDQLRDLERALGDPLTHTPPAETAPPRKNDLRLASELCAALAERLGGLAAH